MIAVNHVTQNLGLEAEHLKFFPPFRAQQLKQCYELVLHTLVRSSAEKQHVLCSAPKGFCKIVALRAVELQAVLPATESVTLIEDDQIPRLCL
ncbi:hypothetical protein D3C79_906600 [compost metagenome]